MEHSMNGDPPGFLAKSPTTPSASEIAAALLAYDHALEGATTPTAGQRIMAMEAALKAAFEEGKRT